MNKRGRERMEELTSALKGIMHYWWQDKAKHLFIIPDTVLREREREESKSRESYSSKSSSTPCQAQSWSAVKRRSWISPERPYTEHLLQNHNLLLPQCHVGCYYKFRECPIIAYLKHTNVRHRRNKCLVNTLRKRISFVQIYIFALFFAVNNLSIIVCVII